MSKLKIKNFGPIKEGYLEGDGFMDIKKVTIFIGNQGSGKSTVAKVISTMMWFEKAINRKDFDEFSYMSFWDFFEYHGIKEYFYEFSNGLNKRNRHADIIYYGDKYSIVYPSDSYPTIKLREGEK